MRARLLSRSTPAAATGVRPTGVLQRMCAACSEDLRMRRSVDAGGTTSDPGVVAAQLPPVHAESGRPLETGLRADMESRFAQDFSHVRVHTSAGAAEAARSVHARAYTFGRDIVFGSGAWQPHAQTGRRLIAHELAHVVQQRGAARATDSPALRVSEPGDPAEREADRAADAALAAGPGPELSPSGPCVARTALDVAGIKKDINDDSKTPPQLDSLIQFKGPQSGEIANAFAADPPTKAGNGGAPPPDPRPVPVDTTLPLQGFFFPSEMQHTDQKALILAGFHGNEHPGWETAEALITELSGAATRLGGSRLFFHTLIIPRVNTGGIADELAGKQPKHWRNRCNRQGVDLNRNFPVAGATASATDCPNNAAGAPIQPEVDGVIDVINQFQPDRILSLHAMSGGKGGVFADPNAASLPGGKAATELARGMGRLIPSASNRPSNALTATGFNPVYPDDTPGKVGGGTSLGAYGPTGVPGKTNVPVITIEAPGYGSLGTGKRTVEEFLRPVRGFVTDPAQLDARADKDIVRDIQAFTLDERRAFLTGRRPSKDDIFQRIQLRVDTAVARLNALSPPVPVKVVSRLRPFVEAIQLGGGAQQSQMDIVFEKFLLDGSRATGWDTLPDKYFVSGIRAKGVNRTDHKAPNWLDETAATRFATILQFSALPGVSRHHWDTDVDFNSTTNADWDPPKGTLVGLDGWLKANAAQAGFVQAFTAGRTGGYSEEKWHYSYAPLAIALRTMWNQDVRPKEDVFDPISAEFQARAKARKFTLPADFETALRAIPIASFTNTIGPGL